jgi:isochorismate pyruvate lyase
MPNIKKCNSLEEVRAEIDKLDEQLVSLISNRSHLIRQAAAFKNSVDEVKAQDRIEFILQKVRHLAIQAGVSPNMISELFSIMINEMVETEIAEFRNTQTF